MKRKEDGGIGKSGKNNLAGSGSGSAKPLKEWEGGKEDGTLCGVENEASKVTLYVFYDVL